MKRSANQRKRKLRIRNFNQCAIRKLFSDPIRQSLRKKTKPFEDSAITEALAVFDELLIAAIYPRAIRLQAIRDMLDTSTECGIVEHVDDCAMNVRDRHLCMMSPDGLSAENLVGTQMLQGELEALPCLAFSANGLAGNDNNVLEDLFG